jgi:hypothetical protein
MLHTHRTNIQTRPFIPLEVDAGTDVTLTVAVSCGSGCDLRGTPVDVMGPAGVVLTGELTTWDGTANETSDLKIAVPPQIGEYAWSIVFPKHELESVIHEESSLPMSFRTIPHETSMAVWDVPSPVGINSSFSVKAGMQCSAGCRLGGRSIQVCDETGAKLGEGTLGDTAWLGTKALYWAEVELTAPPSVGVSSRSVTFVATDGESSHEKAVAAFSFRTDRPPEHRVTVTVIEKTTNAPIENVEVRLGFYVASTGERGVLTLDVPKGTYELSIRREGIQAPPMPVHVIEDLTITVEASPAPTRAQVEEQIMKFEDYPWG